jgi:hypothetical protein
MTIVANTFTSYGSKGQREQLADVIYNISPEDTPLVSMIGREKGTAIHTEWQTDSLAAASTANAQLEADDITSFDAVTATARVGNYHQISRKTLIQSDTDEVINKAGRKSELAYQIAKRGAELKRDIEANVFANIGGVSGGTTTARKTATLGAWLKTNVDYYTTDGGNPAYTSGVPTTARTDGTQRAFTVTILKSVLSDVWTAGGDCKYLFLGPVNKAKASGFAGVATKTWNTSDRLKPVSIVGAADVYVSDFGFVNILPDRFMRERDGYVIDPEYLSISYLRNFKTVKLAKTGDAEKRMLIVEWALKVKQEAALGLCADLTTT